MQDHHDRIVAALMEQLIETGPESMAQAFTALFDLAMRMELYRPRIVGHRIASMRPGGRGLILPQLGGRFE